MSMMLGAICEEGSEMCGFEERNFQFDFQRDHNQIRVVLTQSFISTT